MTLTLCCPLLSGPQVVSTILSDNKDASYLQARHRESQEYFTWKIGGVEVTFATVQNAVASYLGALFVTFVLPGINKTIDDAKASALLAINNTRGDMMDMASSVRAG